MLEYFQGAAAVEEEAESETSETMKSVLSRPSAGEGVVKSVEYVEIEGRREREHARWSCRSGVGLPISTTASLELPMHLHDDVVSLGFSATTREGEKGRTCRCEPARASR